MEHAEVSLRPDDIVLAGNFHPGGRQQILAEGNIRVSTDVGWREDAPRRREEIPTRVLHHLPPAALAVGIGGPPLSHYRPEGIVVGVRHVVVRHNRLLAALFGRLWFAVVITLALPRNWRCRSCLDLSGKGDLRHLPPAAPDGAAQVLQDIATKR